VPPGRHKIIARTAPTGRGGPAQPALWALVNIEVSGQDITGMSIALQPGTTLTGRVTLEGQTARPGTGSLRLFLSPLQQDSNMSSGVRDRERRRNIDHRRHRARFVQPDERSTLAMGAQVRDVRGA
jgi:hypothetical protein